MFKALYGKSHPEVARAMLSVGDVYAALKNFSESLKHKEASLSMFQDFYGSCHPELARALLSLGEGYEAMGQLKESRKRKQESVAMLKVFYKDTHFEVNQASQSLSRTKSAHIAALKESKPVHTSALSLRPVRTVYPQHLALLSTPRHGEEPEGEEYLTEGLLQQDRLSLRQISL